MHPVNFPVEEDEMKKAAYDFDCAVIGGGPGGYASTLFLLRFQHRVGFFHGGKPRVEWAPFIHNYPGYERGISGKQLLRKFARHLSAYPKLTEVKSNATVRRYQNGFEIFDEKNRRYTAKKVVLATGIEDTQPVLENRDDLRKVGVLRYCSVCDGYESTHQSIAVLVADDFGLQKAMFISNWTNRITVLIPPKFKISARRKNQLAGMKIRVVPCEAMKIEWNAKRLKVKVTPDSAPAFWARVVYVELGCEVNASAFSHLRGLRRTKEGFIIVTSEQRTSIHGVYAVGDCVNQLGQVSVAVGQAAVAASCIHDSLIYEGMESSVRSKNATCRARASV
jgi:thioredoxin reductase (NADPH)